MTIRKGNQIIGGISSLILASTYIFGIAILFIVFGPTSDHKVSGHEKLQYIIDHKAMYQTWMLVICVVFGIVLVPLVVAISDNFTKQSTFLTRNTPVFGFIWSVLIIASGMIAVHGIDTIEVVFETNPNSALTSWQTIEVIQYGLGGAIEILGGIWVFLISIASLKFSKFNKSFSCFGLVVGVTGILTIIPVFKDLGIVFGITQIVWFILLGILMIRNDNLE